MRSEIQSSGRNDDPSICCACHGDSVHSTTVSSNRRHVALFLGVIILFFVPLKCFGATPLPACDSKRAFQKADTLLKQKLYSQAEVLLKQLGNCKSLSPIDRFNLGWFYGRAHDFNAAIKIFNSLSPDVPDPQTHQYAVALTQFELEDYKGTVETLKTQQGKQSLTAESVNLLAVAYAKLNLYQDAYTVLREELGRDQFDRLAYLNLVTLLCDAGKLSDAADVAGQAVAVFPQDSEVLVVRGAAYTLLGEVAKAQADFEAAIRISPKQAAPRFFLAVSDYKQGEYAAVVEELSQAIQSGVNDSDLHYLLAESKLRLDPGNLQESMRELNRAIELNSRSVSARSLRGKLLMEGHHFEAAVADLELAHSIDPDSRSATYNLARAYFASGRKEEAKALFEKLTEKGIDPVNEMSDRRLKDTLRGESNR
jgi:tetratricopeptide (TPR) repeat protein